MATSTMSARPTASHRRATSESSACSVVRNMRTTSRRPQSTRYDLDRDESATDGTPANMDVPRVGGDRHSARSRMIPPARAKLLQNAHEQTIFSS